MGRIHTPKGGRTSINVELIHMQALLAFLQDALIAALFAYKNSSEEGLYVSFFVLDFAKIRLCIPMYNLLIIIAHHSLLLS